MRAVAVTSDCWVIGLWLQGSNRMLVPSCLALTRSLDGGLKCFIVPCSCLVCGIQGTNGHLTLLLRDVSNTQYLKQWWVLLQRMKFAFLVALMDVKESLLWNKPRVHRRLCYN